VASDDGEVDAQVADFVRGMTQNPKVTRAGAFMAGAEFAGEELGDDARLVGPVAGESNESVTCPPKTVPI